VAELRARLDDMRNERDRARTDAETWRAAFERELAQRALPAPSNIAQGEGTTPATPAEQVSRLRRAWRWMRATGCFAGAGLLLALATMDSRAQQPQRECFAVAMNPPGQARLDRQVYRQDVGICGPTFAAAIPFDGSPSR